jgi:hypothetical protein
MKTRFVPTRTHGVLDYLGVPFFLAAPRLLGLDTRRAEGRIPLALAAGTLVVAALTDYELGVRRRIPMSVHLALDAGLGLFFVAAPRFLRLRRRARRAYRAFGLFELAEALATRATPTDKRPRDRRRQHPTQQLAEPSHWRPDMAWEPVPVATPS